MPSSHDHLPDQHPASRSSRVRLENQGLADGLSRGFQQYAELLFSLPPINDWTPPDIGQEVQRWAAEPTAGPVRVADFGCGLGVALLGLANRLAVVGVPADLHGVDRGNYTHTPWVADHLPDTPAKVQDVITRYADRITVPGAGIRPFPFPQFHRLDIERDPMPLPAGSCHLILSVATLMFVADKLGLIEKVYDLLAVGGLAFLHLDEAPPLFGRLGELRRIRLPGDLTLQNLLHFKRLEGYDLHLGNPVGHSGLYTLVMRRTDERPLSLGTHFISAEPETWLNTAGDKQWGTIAHYDVPNPPPVQRHPDAPRYPWER